MKPIQKGGSMAILMRRIGLILLVVISLGACDPKDKSPSQKSPDVAKSITQEKTDEALSQPSAILEQYQAQTPDIGKLKINSESSVESISNTFIFIAIIFLLLVTNGLTLLIAKGIFKWRKVVSGGMSAVVPSELLSTFGDIKVEQVKQGKVINENIKKIAEYLAGTTESISILKRELENKETELVRLREFHNSSEREVLIKKVIRLHSLLIRMGNHVASGEISNSSAIDFISEELADIFVDFGIQVISPNIEQKSEDFISDELSIAGFNPTKNQKNHLTINKVNDVGYSYTPLLGNSKVLRPAVVILNKFGE